METPSDFDKIRETVSWDDEKIDNMIERDEREPNEFLKDTDAVKNKAVPLLKSWYDLEGSVSTWTDYLGQPLHGRSINVLKGYHLGVNDNEYCCYSLGVNSWNDVYFQEDFTDNLRFYIEECDNIQGFHVLMDAHNGFSGLSSKCLEYLNDEYTKKSIFSVPTFNYQLQCEGIDTRKRDLHYIFNLMAGTAQYIEHSDLIAPMSVLTSVIKQPRIARPYTNLLYKPESDYQTSAIIAMALDSITVPYRTRDSFSRMDDMIRAVSIHGRTVTTVGMNFPFPMAKEDRLIEVLEKWDGKWFESLTPEVDIVIDNVTSQLVNVRGIDNECLHKETVTVGSDNPAYSCKTAEEMFNLFFQFSFDYTKSSVKTLSTAVRIPPTYPRLFNQDYNLTHDGVNPWGRLAELRLLASLHCTPDTQNLLRAILSPSRSKAIERLAASNGLIPTDFTEMQENIERAISCYSDLSWIL